MSIKLIRGDGGIFSEGGQTSRLIKRATIQRHGDFGYFKAVKAVRSQIEPALRALECAPKASTATSE
ncbi:hypothetical protein KCP70_19450 [Salmonella enterica subsp. enterica]|nr:hypothetical protein KCP70_19450 [Salmonella enterica subsp. enterica]